MPQLRILSKIALSYHLLSSSLEIFAYILRKYRKFMPNNMGWLKQQFICNFTEIVVPPKNWKPRQTPYQQALRNIMISNPIEQNPQGKTGVFEFKHIPIQSMSYTDFIKQYQTRQNILNQKSSDDIQSLFWKSLPYSPPVYGADILGSLMENSAAQWNLNKLDSLLNHGLLKNIRGVNTSYCYIGSWKALFCWHKEDLDLQAINFLHFGKSKFWYCIQADDSEVLENECKKHFFKGFDRCSQYLRHKTCLINPYILKKNNPRLKICKMEQKPGEFIIGFSGAYHCGFNFGINVAEAVNFGTLEWLSKLKEVKYCKCKKSSVRVNYESILDKLLETEEYKNNICVIELRNSLQKQNKSERVNDHQKIVAHNLQSLEDLGTQKGTKRKKTKKIEKKKEKKEEKKNIKKQKGEKIEKIEKRIEIGKKDEDEQIEIEKIEEEMQMEGKYKSQIQFNEQKQINAQAWMNMIQQEQSANEILMSGND